MFKKELLKFIRPEPNSAYNINDTKGLKLLTRLRLGLSHLGDHKFRHNFQDCVSAMCYCGQHIETTTNFLLYCPNHLCERKTLFDKINQVSGTILRQSDSTITKILLLGDNKLDFKTKSFTDVYNRVYFINREIQLSLFRVKPNNSIVSFYSYTNETFMF